MSRIQWSLLASLALFQATAACGSNDNPKLEDIAKQYGAAYCKKLETCMGANAFNQSYSGGQEECASRVFRIHGTDERSLCSQEKWDICTTDLEENADCVEDETGNKRPEIPASCQGC